MTPDSQTFRFDDSGLRNLLKAMESEHFVRIGIFGKSGAHHNKREAAGEIKKFRAPGKLGFLEGSRKQIKGQLSDMTNADVGFLMETGRPKTEHSPRIPARSWLRMPLTNRMKDIVMDAKDMFDKVPQNGDSKAFLRKLGIAAENAIQNAFAEAGPGWEPNAPRTIKEKGSSHPLIDTAQLRRSVASEVM